MHKTTLIGKLLMQFSWVGWLRYMHGLLALYGHFMFILNDFFFHIPIKSYEIPNKMSDLYMRLARKLVIDITVQLECVFAFELSVICRLHIVWLLYNHIKHLNVLLVACSSHDATEPNLAQGQRTRVRAKTITPYRFKPKILCHWLNSTNNGNLPANSEHRLP